MHPGLDAADSGRGGSRIAFGLAAPPTSTRCSNGSLQQGHPEALAPFDAPWGQRYATVEDPDGTSVDLFAPLPS